ncbi:MAG: hypothetical protein ACP5G4_11985 [bacterium]
MRLKVILFTMLLLTVFAVAEDKIYLLVDNHIGFDGKTTVLQIFDKWCNEIEEDCDNSPLCGMKFSIYMLGEEGFGQSETFTMPEKPGSYKLNCNKGNWAQYKKKLTAIRDSVAVFIESAPKPPYVNIAKGINRVARESFRDGDTRTIYVISDYKSLPEKYEAIEVTEFEEDGVPVRLYFTNVEDGKKLLNSTFKWDECPDSTRVFEALRCYSSGEFK